MNERMLDKTKSPTFEEMSLFCQESKERFVEINDWLTATFHTTQSIVFPYGKSYGWCVCHRIKKNLICNVFPESHAFSVMIRMTNTQFQTVMDQVNDYTKNIILNKYPCNEGGWIHYQVSDASHLQDIKLLIAHKLV